MCFITILMYGNLEVTFVSLLFLSNYRELIQVQAFLLCNRLLISNFQWEKL